MFISNSKLNILGNIFPKSLPHSFKSKQEEQDKKEIDQLNYYLDKYKRDLKDNQIKKIKNLCSVTPFSNKHKSIIKQNFNPNDPNNDINNNNNNINNNIDNQESKKVEKKYKLKSNLNSAVLLPEDYFSTDDIEEYDAINLLNEDRSLLKLKITKDKYKIYLKRTTFINDEGKNAETVIFYVDFILDFPASKIIKDINDYNFRAKFDSLYKDDRSKILKEENLEGNIKLSEIYFYLKMPFVFSDRDFVISKKVWYDYNGNKDCCLCHIHSITHKDYPPKKNKPVRGQFINKAGYIRPLNENQCLLFLGSEMDMKMPGSIGMMESKGTDGQETWVKNFLKTLG